MARECKEGLQGKQRLAADGDFRHPIELPGHHKEDNCKEPEPVIKYCYLYLSHIDVLVRF